MKILKLSDIIGFNEQFEHEQRRLNEGLILTHSLRKTISVLERSGFEVVLVDHERYQNRFFIELVESTSNIEKLQKIANNLGWYMASVATDVNFGHVKYTPSNLKNQLSNGTPVYILMEPKYDLPLERIDHDYLYHFTHKIYLEKILKYGLVPKESSKTSIHPNRVYMAFTLSACEKFGRKEANRTSKIKLSQIGKFKMPENDLKGVILRVETNLLPSYIKIYQDPNYYKEGCFTLNTIPPTALQIVKEIDLDY